MLSSGTQDPPADAGKAAARRWHAVADRARDVSVAVGPFRTARRPWPGAPCWSATAGHVPDRPAQRSRAGRTGAVGPVRATAVPGDQPGPTADRRGWHRVPGRSSCSTTAVRSPCTSSPPAVRRDGRQLPGPRPLAGRGVRQLRRGGGSTGCGPAPGALEPAGRRRRLDHLARRRTRTGYTPHVRERGCGRLVAARNAGPARVDAALRCYVNANAWRIATPADLAEGAGRVCRTRSKVLLVRPGALPVAPVSGPRRQQLLHPGDALDQVVVAQRVGQPEVARGAERLARARRRPRPRPGSASASSR